MIGKAFLLALILANASASQTSTGDVMAAYAEYNEALARGDREGALTASKKAYELAETAWGDSRKETALLATNYGDRLFIDKEFENAEPLYRRCIEILDKLAVDSSLAQLGYCQARLAQTYVATSDNRAEAAYRGAIRAFENAAEKGAAPDKAMLGEAYLMVAQYSMPKRKVISTGQMQLERAYREAGVLAAKAIPLLAESYGEKSELVARAYLYQGYAQEAAEDWSAAAESYEKAYDIFDELRGAKDQVTARAFGRFRFAVNFAKSKERQKQEKTSRDGRLPSSPECFFHGQGNEDIELCPVKRNPPTYPSTSYDVEHGGFSLMLYDIAENGRTENIRVLESWPDREFERSSASAVKRWIYSPPKRADGSVVRAVDVQTMITYELSRR